MQHIRQMQTTGTFPQAHDNTSRTLPNKPMKGAKKR